LREATNAFAATLVATSPVGHDPSQFVHPYIDDS
jgi:hypothetical protein